MGETMIANMKQAISSVLELMFFISIQFGESDGPPEGWPAEDQKFIGARLAFSGPVSGSVNLLVPEALAREITANFLGLDEGEVTAEQDRDTVKEALNMVGGHMLSLADEPNDYRLGIPTVIAEAEVDPQAYAEENGNTVFVAAGGYRMAAKIVQD